MLKQFAMLLLAFLVWNWSGYLTELALPEVHTDAVSTYMDHSVFPFAEIQSAEIDEQEDEHEFSIDFKSGLQNAADWQFVFTGIYLERKPFSGHLQIPILLKSCCLLM